MKQLAFCLYLFLGHDLSHPYDEKVDLCKTFFFPVRSIVECGHFLPSVTLVVKAIFYQFFTFSPNDSPSKNMKNVFYFI